jgi:hypothetical protein
MVNYGDLQFVERIMAARRSEMSAEWNVRIAMCIARGMIKADRKGKASGLESLRIITEWNQ